MASEYYDPQQILVSDWRSFFLANKDKMFRIPCVEGEVELNGRWALLNMMMCQPLIKYRCPISRDKHLMLSGIYDASSHARILTQVSRSLEELGYTREELGHDIIMTANDSLNMCYSHLGSFVRTTDIFKIAKTITQPIAKETCTPNYGDITDGNINRMEEIFKNQCDEVDTLLSGDTLDYNVFRAPLLCGALSKGQFFQFILSAGPRTDTDDHVFGRPVEGSFLSGMRNIIDLALESRSAAKATHYNKSQMSGTQYMNRKIHILGSVIWHLYEGDCGSKVYTIYEPNKRTVKFFLGKFFLNDSGELVELTKDKFDSVIGKTVKFRDPPTCKYTDGYCEVCGGTITRSFSRTGNVGFLSNVNTGAPVAQQVLKTKHLTSTNAAEYEVPHELKDILRSKANDIFLVHSLHKQTNHLIFGFPYRDLSKLNDLKYFVSENELHAAYFTDIKYMYVGAVKEDGSIDKYLTRTSMVGENKTYPHLSPEILGVIRKHPEDINVQDGIAWLSLKHIDPLMPVMQCTVVNNSIRRFVNQFRNLITRDISRYTSINDVMRDLTKLIWPRVNTHVTHMSCLAKACMITTKKDFGIPEVTDPDNVMFGSLGNIIPMRDIGGLFAFERYNIASAKPVTYITPKRHGIYSEFMGFADTIQRDEHWPVMTDSPVEYET